MFTLRWRSRRDGSASSLDIPLPGKERRRRKMPEKPISEETGALKKLDTWAFTSKRAIREFERKGSLEEVKKDIVEEVLEGEDWTDQDGQYLEDIERLSREGVVEEKGSYWYCSPYPPTYRALNEGEILGKRFRAGQDIVYQPAKNVDSEEKLIIGKFSTTTETRMHRDHKTMKGKMSGHK